ncbi:hypothetical protein Clacol_003232 [Clathrus columnatus]|uniref:Uncharacterized protein n=1 Tax=Clathrus columnatus TaxID=1419009 RepID=A0AAV5A7N0_9AGAM|nr:hypothetical protein Clacol_003232 [Clathrus columnatus]
MTKIPFLQRIKSNRRSRTRTSSSSSSSSFAPHHSSVEQENLSLVQSHQRSPTIESSAYSIIPLVQDDMRILDVSNFIDIPRPISPKVVNVNVGTARGAHLPHTLRMVNQNIAETEEEPGDIPDEDEIPDDATIVPVPSVRQNFVPILGPPLSAIPAWKVVIGSDVLNDPVLYIQIQQGFYHEVWDPTIRDGLVLLGQALYYPVSASSQQLSSQLIWLSLEVYMACPRKALRQTESHYLCLMRNNTEIGIKSANKKQQQPSKYRQVDYPTPSLISPQASCDLLINNIEQYPAVQTCFFKLVLPVGNPILFHDSGAGDLIRFFKIRARGVVRVTSNEVVNIRQSTKDVDLTVNVLKTSRFLGNIAHSPSV